jgi:hypothetical protein
MTMLFPEVFGFTDATSNSCRGAGVWASTRAVRASTAEIFARVRNCLDSSFRSQVLPY